MSKISVIVPVYNAEKYLAKCVDSLLNQTLQDIEIILVDDGSADKSPIMCDDYAKKNSYIKVLHKTNGGVSSARNAGLKIASGEFVAFLDSDDYIEANAYEVAYNIAKGNSCDYVMWGFFCDFVDENENITNQKISIPQNVKYESTQRKELLNISGYLWNKLYSRKLLNELNLSFNNELTLYEDLLFNTKFITQTKNAIFIPEALTHYIQRNIVSLGTKYRENYLELSDIALECHKKLLRFWNVDETVIKTHITDQKFKSIWGAMRNICSSKLSQNEKKENIARICKKENYSRDIISFKSRSIKDILRKLILLTKCSKLITKLIK